MLYTSLFLYLPHHMIREIEMSTQIGRLNEKIDIELDALSQYLLYQKIKTKEIIKIMRA